MTEPEQRGPVVLDPQGPHRADLAETYRLARQCHGDPRRAVDLARHVGSRFPRPLHGQTRGLWEALATLGAADLSVARIIEPHLDALAILDQAGCLDAHDDDAAWGVYAAEAPGCRLTAAFGPGGWTLDGVKPWCSLAGGLTSALVTAHDGDRRRLFAIDLRDPGVRVDPRPWTALGLSQVPSGPITLTAVPARPIGETDWYLQRPGFFWGGVGVAAVWYGGAVALARRLYDHCTARTPDQIALLHLGTADRALANARDALATAAAEADSHAPPVTTGSPAVSAARTRARVVDCAETILALAAHGMGPEPLAFDPEHGRRVADLELYLRQDHAERSLAGLGAQLVAGEDCPW